MGCRLLAGVVVAVGLAFAQSSQAPPQRTITTAPPQDQPPSAAAGLPAAPNEAQVQSLIDSYRRSWEKMNDRTRKMMLSHGGQTPEQFEHTIRQRMSGMRSSAVPGSSIPTTSAAPSAAAESSSSNAVNLDVLNTMSSVEDLSAIRDGNVKRVQNGGCAPQINARIADLKGKLAVQERILHPDAAAQAVSVDAPAKPAARTDAVSRQLDSVLGLESAEAPPVKSAPSRSASADQRKQAESEIARIQADLDRLISACAAAR